MLGSGTQRCPTKSGHTDIQMLIEFNRNYCYLQTWFFLLLFRILHLLNKCSHSVRKQLLCMYSGRHWARSVRKRRAAVRCIKPSKSPQPEEEDVTTEEKSSYNGWGLDYRWEPSQGGATSTCKEGFPGNEPSDELAGGEEAGEGQREHLLARGHRVCIEGEGVLARPTWGRAIKLERVRSEHSEEVSESGGERRPLGARISRRIQVSGYLSKIQVEKAVCSARRFGLNNAACTLSPNDRMARSTADTQ